MGHDETIEWLEGWCAAYILPGGDPGAAAIARLAAQCTADAAKEGMSRADLDAAAGGDLLKMLAERQAEIGHAN
jgi:hypothetical protein